MIKIYWNSISDKNGKKLGRNFYKNGQFRDTYISYMTGRSRFVTKLTFERIILLL